MTKFTSININKKRAKEYFFLHACVFLYSLTAITTKLASNYEAMSFLWMLFLGLTVVILGTYAIVWQQAMKPFDASVAYSNKSVCFVWQILIAAILFGEGLTFQNINGSILIIGGTFIVASSADEEKAK